MSASNSVLHLPDSWGPILTAKPETGMSYQIVTLTLRDGANAQVYSGDLRNTGTFISSSGGSGTWRIEVRLTNVTGTLNFRVQKRS